MPRVNHHLAHTRSCFSSKNRHEFSVEKKKEECGCEKGTEYSYSISRKIAKFEEEKNDVYDQLLFGRNEQIDRERNRRGKIKLKYKERKVQDILKIFFLSGNRFAQ